VNAINFDKQVARAGGKPSIMRIGILGGTGLDDPEIMSQKQKFRYDISIE
jgi:hypothetical protein